MKKNSTAAISPLSHFFRNSSEAEKMALYSLASSIAIDSQRKVLEEAKSIKDAKTGASA
ncbi:hypothetical protein [Pseudomonas mandelii]|uniref:hypothetical protein n=1 Tax=Pseudomonas mandelii TaxID=75612 RepID=UPI00224B1FAC|nr:hypothetical protein [Pseudomonas mandelii]MCX2901639.1 hypothetical protein [Pseudomonas mandelii]